MLTHMHSCAGITLRFSNTGRLFHAPLNGSIDARIQYSVNGTTSVNLPTLRCFKRAFPVCKTVDVLEESIEKMKVPALTRAFLDFLEIKKTFLYTLAKQHESTLQHPCIYETYSENSLNTRLWAHFVHRISAMALFFSPGTSQKAIACHQFKPIISFDEGFYVVEDELYGNLSGTCMHHPIVDSQGVVLANGSECNSVRYVYSQDDHANGVNLLHAVMEGAAVTLYTYHAGSHLIASEQLFNDRKSVHRIFYTYEAQGKYTEIIFDDGIGRGCKDLRGVTLRRVKRIEFDQGLPIVEKESFLNENKQIQPLQTCIKAYDKDKRLVFKQLYNADHELTKTFLWAYNSLGQLVHMHSPSSMEEYVYDGTTKITRFLHRHLTRYDTYEQGNCVQRREVDIRTQEERIWTFRYKDGRCVEERGSNNEVKTHEFDRLGRKLKTTLVTCKDQNVCTYVTQWVYDPIDLKAALVKKNVDEQHQILVLNTRGQIIKRYFPNGLHESREYRLDGVLKKRISHLGGMTEYQADGLGRLLDEKISNKDAELVNTITYTYKGLQCISQQYAGGLTTHFRRDGAGRLIEQLQGQKSLFRLSYDASGRVKEKIEGNTVTTSTYNSQDLLACERIHNTQGHLEYERHWVYDLQGDCIEFWETTGQGERLSHKKYAYNAWREMIKQ